MTVDRSPGPGGNGSAARRGTFFSRRAAGRTTVWDRPWPAGLAVAALYLLAARLCEAFTVPGQMEPVIWAPAGIALASVLLGGRRMLFAVAAGALLSEILDGETSWVVAVVAAGSTAEAALGSALMSRFRIGAALEEISDVAGLFALGAVLSTVLGATVEVATMLLSHAAPAARAGVLWRACWLGDMTGIAVFASGILIFAARGLRRRELRPAAETVSAAVLLGGVTLLLARVNSPYIYAAVPFLLLLAVRYRQRGAVIGCLALTTVSMLAIHQGFGPFAGDGAEVELLRTQLFLAMATLTALLTSAALSQRDAAQSALRRLADSERALADAQRMANVGSFEWSRRTGRATASEQLWRIFGHQPGVREPAPENWFGQVHPDDVAGVKQAMHRDALGEPYSMVHRIVRPDGSIRTVESQGRVELDASGQPVRTLGTVLDITAFKAAEDRFRSFLETAPDAIVILDEAGNVVYANSRTERLFGHPPAELVGHPVDRLVPIDLSAAASALGRARGSGQAPTVPPLGWGLDLFAQHRDGRRLPVEISLSPLRTADGNLISAAIRDVTERKHAADALAHQATHDPLTGLPNRLLFLDRLEHALARSRRTGDKLAVLFLDLDDFKVVNDTHGHEAGDQLLLTMTARLQAAVRTGDTVARFGGDEFVVLCEEVVSDEVALEVADRLRGACARPVTVGGAEHMATLSAGAVIVDGGAAEPSDLLRDADAAMYRAKALGKGRVELFGSQMRQRHLAKMDVEAELRRALREEQLRLHYQPIISLERDQIVGFEALMRWEHPERGLLEPGEFISVAEGGDLIFELGDWAIAEACRAACGWRREHSAGAPLTVSVNLSPRQLSRPGVADTVARVLEGTGLDPGRLALEITETTLISDTEAARRELGQLKELGVRIVLDDFGTGASSLSTLRRFTIDALKLDRRFVDGIGQGGEDDSVVEAVLSMAHALDVSVTAEGVERPGQLARLRAGGCEQAQGFLFSRPVSEAAVLRSLTERRQPAKA